jgi:DNA repair exonuclease SbcCD ATPase subunit
MRRLIFTAVTLAIFSLPSHGQTTPSDSQTLQALLSEVRQMRQDLHATTVAVQRAQILVFRVQAQEAAVARALQRLDAARSKLEQVQAQRRELAHGVRQLEEALERLENPVEKKQVEDSLPHTKERLENATNQEQEAQAREAEASEQLRLEQARLDELHGQLDRLDKALEESSRPPAGNPR